MSKPIIGITPNFSFKERTYSIAETYVESIKKAGGIPLLIPHAPEDAVQLAPRLDGLLISGGPDLEPAYFGETPSPKVGSICPERDESEMALLKAFVAVGKPILGICRGVQALNVGLGGTLYQDLGSDYEGKVIKHNQDAPRWYFGHKATLVAGSKLAGILGETEIGVNSFHHQAVKDIAPGFVAVAHAPDGVIEAIEKPDHPFCLGVQWHPEGMFALTTYYDKLFAAFVAACHG